MTKQEIIARTQAAAKLIDQDIIDLVTPEIDTFADYWAGSISQSYCDAVESGNVRIVKD